MKTSSLTITSLILITCLVWMDACLYYQIQCNDDASSNAHPNRTRAQSFNSSRPTESERQQMPLCQEHNENSPSIKLMNKFSFAFQGMSVKLMMTDPVDNYLLAPLSEAFADLVNFKENLWFISANMVSYAGVLSALVAAKLVSHDSSTLHKLSYIMFQLRTWLDDLDGAVARSRLGIRKHVSLQKTSGYFIDGICDAVGFIAYIVGCYIFLKKTMTFRRGSRRPSRYNLQSITEVKSASPSSYIPLQQCEEDEPGYGKHQNVGEMGANEEEKGAESDRVNFDTMEHFDYYDRRRNDNGEVPTNGGGDDLMENFRDSDLWKRHRKFANARVYLEKIQDGKQSSIIFYRYIKEKFRNNLSERKLFLLVLCFLLQIAMSATFWNRYILVYRDLLETPSDNEFQARAKSKILRSNIMYVIIWFWRLTNGHSLMQMLIASVFIGKLWRFLDLIKYVGFIEIILLATVTELHVIDIRNYLNN